jgi:glycerol-3-phosphate dehydrogenase subunit B
VWHGSDRPGRVVGVAVELEGVAGRRNVNALELANRLDDPERRAADLARISTAIARVAAGRSGRVALPAIVGLRHHAEAWADARAVLPLDPFEVPLVPPSVPGIRLWQALRARIRAGGGRVQVGEEVHRIEVVDGRVVAVELEAATRVHRITTGALVLATGGIAGGGLIGTVDGRLVEPLLGLPVETPPQDDWLRREALDPAGHPVESAGIRTDAQLHPVDGHGTTLANVFVVGGLLAGQRALRERCGDGVAVASGWRAATTILEGPGTVAEAPTPVAASSRSRRTTR